LRISGRFQNSAQTEEYLSTRASLFNARSSRPFSDNARVTSRSDGSARIDVIHRGLLRRFLLDRGKQATYFFFFSPRTRAANESKRRAVRVLGRILARATRQLINRPCAYRTHCLPGGDRNLWKYERRQHVRRKAEQITTRDPPNNGNAECTLSPI